MQSNLAPAVTPRPVKHQSAAASPRGAIAASPNARGGRTYMTSPLKSNGGNPFDTKATAYDVAVRPPESSTTSSSPLRLRKKPLIVSGDIRNLDSNFDIAMSRTPVTIPEVAAVFSQYAIDVTNDEALTLSHEYEENNDRGLSYAAFVEDLVQLIRHTALHRTSTQRLHAKKMRLCEHCDKLSTKQSMILDELMIALRDKLRVSWSSVKEAFRQVDKDKHGRVTRAQFNAVCASLEIPVTPVLVDIFVVDNTVDATAFLTYFGSAFQHGDTNSVGFSLVYSRPLGELFDTDSASTVSNTLHSPGVTHALNSKSPSKKKQATVAEASAIATDLVYMEKLRIILSDKIAARHSDVKKAFMVLDRDGNGLISAQEFDHVLKDFNLKVSADDLAALLASFDTNQDGSIDYHEFFAKFGDVMKPSAAAMVLKKKHLLENSSLVFGGERDIKGANKNRLALSSPGNDLKDAFSRLPDDAWRAIYVELSHSDAKLTGVVPSAELLRVLAKYLGDLPKQNYASLFRACGSHTTQLMNYRQLVKSYRARVMDPVDYFHQDAHALTEKTYRKSPTESLVMVWSIRVQRAQMPPLEWASLKEDLWRADARRVGRVLAPQFKDAVKQRMGLTEDQAAFLCFFYEDKNLTADNVTIRYGSFLTDYEDSGLEDATTSSTTDTPPSTATSKRQPRVEGKGRVRPPGYGIHNSHHHASGPGVESLAEQEHEEARLRQCFALNIRILETQLQESDPEKKGFVSMDQFISLCTRHSATPLRETSKAFTSLIAKYIAHKNFYYRGFLLDFDVNAGLHAQALVVQDDEDEEETRGGGDGEGTSADALDVYTVKEALRHHLTSSLSRQKAVYKLMQRMDPGKSGVLGYAELRRALERLGLALDESVARELCALYEEEDESTGARTGRVKYLLLLHALGGRDPDKLDGMSDLSSNCSYYSSISISPRAVGRAVSQSRPVASSRDHVVAARAVSNAIDKAVGNASGASTATAVERKIQAQLESKRGKWKQLSRAFQQVDSERRGSVSAASFRKVLADAAGVHLDVEDVARLQLKYDVEQNGRLHYHEFLRHMTNSMSALAPVVEEISAASSTLPSLASPRGQPKSVAAGPMRSGLSESLRQGVKAKWKPIYASFKTLDKQSMGRVSAPHFRQLLEWYALAVSDDAFLALLRLFDHDADGGVDYNKFMKACFA